MNHALIWLSIGLVSALFALWRIAKEDGQITLTPLLFCLIIGTALGPLSTVFLILAYWLSHADEVIWQRSLLLGPVGLVLSGRRAYQWAKSTRRGEGGQ